MGASGTTRRLFLDSLDGLPVLIRSFILRDRLLSGFLMRAGGLKVRSCKVGCFGACFVVICRRTDIALLLRVLFFAFFLVFAFFLFDCLSRSLKVCCSFKLEEEAASGRGTGTINTTTTTASIANRAAALTAVNRIRCETVAAITSINATLNFILQFPLYGSKALH